ncbi:MAG: MFS transporter [Desulfobacteraceae bacterium]|nr:MFS transporter [Desulfobacteraceae bacterium]MBC2755250.1 MFS transporter [Desulfobacteraceae bacterium]
MKIIKPSLPSAKVFWGISSFQALAMFRRGLFYAFLSIYLRYFLGLFLDTGFGVSSRVLSYIFNTESVAIICFGLLAGRLGRWLGDGQTVCLGAFIAIAYLMIYAFTNDLKWIYVASCFRGMADVIILAASYAFVSVLIPPERRGTLFGLFNATLFLSWGVAGTLIAGPIVDLLFHMGASQATAYRSAYLSGLVMVIVGLLIQSFLVFVLLPKTGISAQRRRT